MFTVSLCKVGLVFNFGETGFFVYGINVIDFPLLSCCSDVIISLRYTARHLLAAVTVDFVAKF